MQALAYRRVPRLGRVTAAQYWSPPLLSIRALLQGFPKSAHKTVTTREASALYTQAANLSTDTQRPRRKSSPAHQNLFRHVHKVRIFGIGGDAYDVCSDSYNCTYARNIYSLTNSAALVTDPDGPVQPVNYANCCSCDCASYNKYSLESQA